MKFKKIKLIPYTDLQTWVMGGSLAKRGSLLETRSQKFRKENDTQPKYEIKINYRIKILLRFVICITKSCNVYSLNDPYIVLKF